MGLSVNILTSGFLVTVVIFLLLMGLLFWGAESRMGEVRNFGNPQTNNADQLKSAYDASRVAYILAFIGSGVSLLLALLYAGHELVFKPSEYWHLVLYLIIYALLVISVIYAFTALHRLYSLKIEDRNGADAYLWAGLLMAVFAFVGLTATGSGRLGMNAVRDETNKRIEKSEKVIHEHIPAIRSKVEEHLPITRAKIDELHTEKFGVPQPEGCNQGMMTTASVSSPNIVRNVSVPSSALSQSFNSSPSFTSVNRF